MNQEPIHPKSEHKGGDTAQTAGETKEIRKRFFMQLGYSAEYFHSLIENVSDTIAILNPDGTIYYVSPSVERMFGYKPDELLGIDGFTLVHPDDLPLARELFAQVLSTPGNCGPLAELRARRKNGAWFYVEAIGKSMPDEFYHPLFIVSLRDITSRKKTEEALRRSEEKLRLHSEQTRMALIEWNTDFIITRWNLAAERIFGYKAEEALGRDGSFIVPEKNRGFVTQVGRDLLAQAGGERATNENVTRDGRTITCDWFNTPLTGADGKVIGIVSLVEDVSERYKMQEQLRELAGLLDLAQDAVIVRDLDGRVRYWNRSAQRLYGWSADEIVGEHFSKFVGNDHELFDAAQKVLMASGTWRGELIQTAKSGSEVIVSSRWTLVRDEQGEPKSVLVCNTDITEKKQLESHIRRAQRLESIGTLAGGIAHDLNNILAPIIMISPLLYPELQDETSRARLATIESSARRGLDLVQQILTFSRGLKQQKGLIQLQPLLRDFARMIKDTFPRTIALQLQIPSGLWCVEGNATELHQVLMNLCINARDAMPKGGTLTLSAENIVLTESDARRLPHAHAGAYVVWQVSDTGHGIAPENLEHIFDPFFTTKEHGKGTGLGLSILLGIVRSHSGCVEVQSQLGVGTKFKIYLPAVVADAC